MHCVLVVLVRPDSQQLFSSEDQSECTRAGSLLPGTLPQLAQPAGMWLQEAEARRKEEERAQRLQRRQEEEERREQEAREQERKISGEGLGPEGSGGRLLAAVNL